MSACFLVIGSLYAAYGGRSLEGEIFLSGKGPQLAVIVLIYIFVAAFACSWAVVSNFSNHRTRIQRLLSGVQDIRMRNHPDPYTC